MSFASNLSTKINEYTNFSVFGKTMQLPYRLGGKLTPAQIRGNIVANLPSASSQSAIQNWVNSNIKDTGIDCSCLQGNHRAKAIRAFIFYTVITRARNKLKIYCTQEVEKKVLERIQPKNYNHDVALLKTEIVKQNMIA